MTPWRERTLPPWLSALVVALAWVMAVVGLGLTTAMLLRCVLYP